MRIPSQILSPSPSKFDGDAKVWLGFLLLLLSFLKVSQSLLDHFHCVYVDLVEDYDVDVRNIDNGVVDIRNNVVDKCCKQSKT
jgi:hypothetical protein